VVERGKRLTRDGGEERTSARASEESERWVKRAMIY
jgi:hypothetical protein